MVTSELYEVHLSNGGRSRTAAACSGVEFRNGSQLVMELLEQKHPGPRASDKLK